jgi:Superinfection immunity protein
MDGPAAVATATPELTAGTVLAGLLGFSLIALVVVAAIACYFLPTIVAVLRKKKNAVAIGVLNGFFGWSFVGWVIALVWAVTTDAAPAQPMPVVTVVNPSLPQTAQAQARPGAQP